MLLPLSPETFLTNLKKLFSLLEVSSAEKNTQPLCHAGGAAHLHPWRASSHLWGNSNLMAQCASRIAAFQLSSSLLNCWVTRFLCIEFTLLPLSPPATSSGMGGRREGEVKAEKMFVFTQDHYYDTAGSHMKTSLQAARGGWRREISDYKKKEKQPPPLLQQEETGHQASCKPHLIPHQSPMLRACWYVLWISRYQDKALCCDLEELSSCCDFFSTVQQLLCHNHLAATGKCHNDKWKYQLDRFQFLRASWAELLHWKCPPAPTFIIK